MTGWNLILVVLKYMPRYFKNVRCFGGGALRDDTKNGYVAD